MNIKQLHQFAQSFPAIPISIQFQMTDFDPIAITQAFWSTWQALLFTNGAAQENRRRLFFYWTQSKDGADLP